MPSRPFSRAQTWVLPPTLEELIPADHAARFVAALVDGLERAAWAELGIAPDGEARGAAGYSPRALLGAWLYGFMVGVRSTRGLELACQERLPFLWLTGWQRPDHNTLWRFYAAHRAGLRRLFRRTVRAAVRLGLVDLALQAVDGTKLSGNAARERTLNPDELRQLQERVEAALAELEAQGRGEGPPPPRLPRQLAEAERLRARVREALAEAERAEGPGLANATDPDAVLVKGRRGKAAGYNGQVVAAGLDRQAAGRAGRLLLAEAVEAAANDQGLLVPMLARAEATAGVRAERSLADGGYHAGPELERCDALGYAVLVPDGHAPGRDEAYHKDHFTYDEATDTYRCPREQVLRFAGMVERPGDEPAARRYRAPAAVCAACPVRAACTPSRTKGRSITIRPDDGRLRAHRALMATPEARALYRNRKGLVEPVFGILKERQAGGRLLLRGLDRVRAEWSLLATAFNLNTLARVWRGWATDRRPSLVGALTSAACAG